MALTERLGGIPSKYQEFDSLALPIPFFSSCIMKKISEQLGYWELRPQNRRALCSCESKQSPLIFFFRRYTFYETNFNFERKEEKP